MLQSHNTFCLCVMCPAPWGGMGEDGVGVGGGMEGRRDLVNFQDCKEAATADREARLCCQCLTVTHEAETRT